MAIILNIETSTTVCSVALSKGEILLTLKEIDEGYSHAENLSLLIEKAFEETGLTYHDLDAIAVTKGPGSYTGLRIGVSTAKGLAYSLEIPLISVNTLESMVASSKISERSEKIRIPMLDARRMEVYMAIYNSSGESIEETSAKVLDENSFDALSPASVVLFGPGAEKCMDLYNGKEHISILSGVKPSAQNMIAPSYQKFIQEQFEDVAYFEPFYLKDFVAGKPKKML